MRRSISVMGMLWSILLGVAAIEASGQATKPSARWAPDSATLKQLGVAVPVEKYTIRAPKGYEIQQANNTPPGMRAWGWTGAARRDGSKASVTMTLLTLPASQQEQTKNLSLDQLADRLIGGVKRQRSNWKQEKTEKGVVNGLNFAQDSLGWDRNHKAARYARIPVCRPRR